MQIIDRRLNAGGKSLANRQRFLRRAKAAVREAVRENSAERGIKDVDGGGKISIPSESVREPRLRRGPSTGRQSTVLPGNKRFVSGDTVAKDQAGSGDGGSRGSEEGAGQDEFEFMLSQDEYLDLFFEDLELPNMAKKAVAVAERYSTQRAGYSVSGSPTSLAVARTLRNSLSRRAALKRPKQEAIDDLQSRIQSLPEGSDERHAVQADLDSLLQRARRVPYIDPIDLRFRRFERIPKPVSQAVIFCLMDTSASMTAHMKDLAKRFFALLYVFLQRKYAQVDVVFIRHTHLAEEVDEDTFFSSRDSGGTVVSTALEKMGDIVASRFPLADWNIYGAQASDGDNSSLDSEKTGSLLKNSILPVCQYFAYIEVGREPIDRPGFIRPGSELWRTYKTLDAEGDAFAMCEVSRRTDIFPVFGKLFERRTAGDRARSP